jgi:purine-binding chemotaxis protein CheW
MDSRDAEIVAPADTAEELSELWRERARILAEVPAAEETGEKLAVLSFQLGEEIYGVELKSLSETRRSVPIRRLPGAPRHLLGAANLRGELVPVVDLCPILGLPQREMGPVLPCLLILAQQRDKLALAVDRTKEIVTFPAKEIQPPPLSLDPDRAIFVRGEILVDHRPLILLDVEKITADPRIAGQAHEGL